VIVRGNRDPNSGRAGRGAVAVSATSVVRTSDSTRSLGFTELAQALNDADEGQRQAARDMLRGFITAIMIPPGDGRLQMHGDLGRMLSAAGGERGLLPFLVAGGGFEPPTFGL
jgi:hypothetical protein